MQVIKNNLKETQDSHNIYVEKTKLFKEFMVGEHVYFRIKPKKRSLQIGSCVLTLENRTSEDAIN